jgi:putative tricarboxylic transport membrane protein
LLGRTIIEPVFYVVKADSSWKTLDDAVAAARAKPQEFTWGACGAGCIGTWGIGQLLYSKGIKLSDTNTVTYGGGGEIMAALAGGQIQIASAQYSEVRPVIAAGRVRALGVVSDQRIAEYPDLKTVAEQGYQGVTIAGWHGIGGPPGLSPEIVKFWTDELVRAGNDAQFKQRAAESGKLVSVLTGPEFEKWVNDQYESYLPLAQAMGLR